MPWEQRRAMPTVSHARLASSHQAKWVRGDSGAVEGCYFTISDGDRMVIPFADFGELGFANTTIDSRLFVRPYTTLGFNNHFRVGAT